MRNNLPTPNNATPSVKWADLTDADLVGLYKDGSDFASSVLVVRHFNALRRVAFAIVKDYDVAADVVNDVFGLVLSEIRRGDYSECGTFRAYASRHVTILANGRLQYAV